MKIKYKFNFPLQAAYGIASFAATLAALLLLLNRLEWLTAFTVGIGNFAVAGFYSQYCKKC